VYDVGSSGSKGHAGRHKAKWKLSPTCSVGSSETTQWHYGEQQTCSGVSQFGVSTFPAALALPGVPFVHFCWQMSVRVSRNAKLSNGMQILESAVTIEPTLVQECQALGTHPSFRPITGSPE
jgi:hypothetical protein